MKGTMHVREGICQLVVLIQKVHFLMNAFSRELLAVSKTFEKELVKLQVED